jgi:hypothetical protein
VSNEDDSKDSIHALILAGMTDRPAYTPPVPTDRREFAQVAADEFASMLTPADTIASMPYGAANYEQLSRELRNGRYVAAAEEIIWTYNGETGRDSLAVIPDSIWSIFKPDASSDFWVTGYFDTSIPSATGAYTYAFGQWMRAFNTRIWVRPSFVPAPTRGAEADDRARPNVAMGDLQRWHRIFAEVHPDAPEALALQSAAAMFPDNRVPRQWVRDLRGPQKRGKPTSRQK